MNIQNIGTIALGVFFLYLSVRNFIFFFKGGAFGLDLSSPLGPGSFKYKAKGEKTEEILLLRNAVGFLIFGAALCYTGLTSMFA